MGASLRLGHLCLTLYIYLQIPTQSLASLAFTEKTHTLTDDSGMQVQIAHDVVVLDLSTSECASLDDVHRLADVGGSPAGCAN